ncbi:vacuolar protein-sorting-associated protein 25 [Frankliniella occidentalis]|uniref:Vacuolar protein-sorting-associated protein 25 n=1 Tax=Frankliniella occidentalis TaxID=133901 RepID=A0A6J1S535_FRAOC|nr:vacuolar protein-sorting-associated protein 25 [Frankliniella occidentalis]
MSEIEWPWQYSFPPFFTIQPHAETKARQLKAWHTLVLNYFKANNLSSLDIREAHQSSLFNNSSIDRKLPPEGILLVLEDLQKSGNATPLDKTRNRWLVYWHTLEEWAAIIYSWAQANGFLNTVCTFFELVSGDDTNEQEFHGLDEEVLLRAIQVLETQKKAEVIPIDDSHGVKFF